MFKWIIVLMLSFCVTYGASAQDYSAYDTSALRNNQPNCEEAYSAPEEAMCVSQLYDLNQEEETLYKAILGKANSEKTFADNLKVSETSWQNYRDTTCHLLADGLNGTQQTSLIIDCLAEKTKERVSFFKGISNRSSK